MAANSIWMIGCGNMAGAMLQGWLASGEPAGRFAVIDPGKPELPEGVILHETAPERGMGDSFVVLGFKPQMLAAVGKDLAPAIGSETVLLSLLAGVELKTLRNAFPDAREIIRVMPNLPVAHRKGTVGLISESPQSDASHRVTSLMNSLGTSDWIADEAVFHAVSALVGSGPAFVYRFMDALAKGAAQLGLPAEQAQNFAVAMVEGAGALASLSDEQPSRLAERVASPGGMTRFGLDVLDEDGDLENLVARALAAAADRAKTMAREAAS